MNGVASRPGFAIPLALCMLAAVAGVAAASFHAVTQNRRSATRSAAQERAAAAADSALHILLDSWPLVRRDSMPVGGVDSTHGTEVPTVVIRITGRLYWLAAAARVARGTSVEATRAYHLLVEVVRPEFPTSAALVSAGDVMVAAGARITVDDSPPPGWSDCPRSDSPAAASILVPEGYSARDDADASLPGTSIDSAAGRAETYTSLGDLSATELAIAADLTLGAGAILSPPADSSPRVVHGLGDLVVTGNGGQGVLLVDGHLEIRGPFRFAGVVVARRGIDVNGSDVSVYGAVLSADTEGVRWLASGRLQRSTCAIDRVSDAVRRPLVVGARGWTELF